MNEGVILIFQLIVLLFSAVIHEVSHGLIAEKLGDPTARLAGRLTLNPLKHLDFFGSLVLPLSLFFFSGGSFIFGWAKPVPYDPRNLGNPKTGAGLIAAAGPASNLLIAFVFGSAIRLLRLFDPGTAVFPYLLFFDMVVYINAALMVFNLLPLPPLDGSKVLFALLPASAFRLEEFLIKYGQILLLFIIFFGFGFIRPAIFLVHKLLAG